MGQQRRHTRFAAACLTIALGAVAAAAADGPSFERDVRPIFKTYCFDCHGAGEELKGQLDLRLARFAQRGGENGPAIVPGDADGSFLVQRLVAGEMPPTAVKLPAEKIAVVRSWIAAGAATGRTEPEQLPPGIDITPEERTFWAFRPIENPPPPAVAPGDGENTPIDSFLLEKLRQRGWSLAPEADRRTLILRASLDLVGLPPAPEEVDAFVADASGQAYERLVDRLLASPHYGERWARHWLDVAGYADSEGNGTDDTPRPYSYKYRDWVIRALNADQPLDEFLVEQLAGDELVPPPWTNLSSAAMDRLVATGFLRTAPDGTASGGDPAEAANQVVADTLKIVGSALYGLSIGCAQCHDHRYDPIPQSDYYRLRAVFEPALDPAHWRRPAERLLSLWTDADRARAAAVDAEAGQLQAAYDAKQRQFVEQAFEKELEKFPAELRDPLRVAYKAPADQRTPEQRQLLDANPSVNFPPGVLYQYNQPAADELKKDAAVIAAKRAERPVEDFLSVLAESPAALPTTRIFHRGDYRQPKGEVPPGDLTIAAAEGARAEFAAKNPSLASSGRRLALARHLTSGQHPLLARVLVNRIWLHHFGRGLVETPGDFGALGTRPTHAELLDWLASDLVRGGWSMKRLHKTIMLSRAYRQSSVGGSTADADSLAALYGRFPVRRLDAEIVRDRMLAASGRLDVRPFGPAVSVTEDAVGQVVAQDDSPRRSIYLQVRRTKPISLLAAFDAPAGTLNCERRVNSTAAPQSLMLMNGDFVLKHAGELAQRVRREVAPPGGRAEQISRAWQIAYLRAPADDELQLATRFLDEQQAHLNQTNAPGDRDLLALTNLCQQLLCSNEFLYVD